MQSNNRIRNYLLIATSTLLFVPLGARADQIVPFDPVSVYADAYYTACPDYFSHYEIDVDWFGGRDPTATQIFAQKTLGPAHGAAVLSWPDVALALADSTGSDYPGPGACTAGSAAGMLTTRASIVDPLGRPSVKLHAKVRGAASGRDTRAIGQAFADGYWSFTVGSGLDNRESPWVSVDANGNFAAPIELPGVYNQRIFWVEAIGSGFGQSSICDSVGGCANIDGISVEFDRTIVFDSAPGTLWLQLKAFASHGGLSIIDPVIEPDPANPEVVVTMVGPYGPGGFVPLPGVTAQELAAEGLDPQPFINLGFLSPTSEPPPPPPPPSNGGGDPTPPPPPPSNGGGDPTPPPPPPSKDWCGPGFWLNNATKFGGSAWPASAPTYHDYNSTAGQLAGCPTASGNPTLLDVLTNASLYFTTQMKGAGFNCVADYLSRTSELSGTSADNSGVCSIDQLGRHVE